MNILVLNGSPKGQNSITLQTALYLEQLYKGHTFTYLHVGQRIRSFEQDMSQVTSLVNDAHLVLFVYPVYTFLAPYQLHQFISLMKRENISLAGKFASQISTSKHFYDITAHKYIEENCYDFGARYINGLSADMEDLLCSKGQVEASSYFEKLLFDMEHNIYKTRVKPALPYSATPYNKSLPNKTTTLQKDVLLLTNVAPTDHNLNHMIEDFIATCDAPVRIINLREFPFSGGCLGCFHCSTTGLCIYKDNFDTFLREEIQTADGIVYAYTIEDHYTHPSFKCFDDRQFCDGHRFVSHGMPIGYLISGDYQNESNLQTIIEARSEVSGMYLCGVATDEVDPVREIQNLSASLTYALTHQMEKPANFYGVGGTKIFRDLVYLMQGMMKADHKFYKKNGIYDFPHNQPARIMRMKVLGSIIQMPSVKRKMKGKLHSYMVAPYTKVIEEAAK